MNGSFAASIPADPAPVVPGQWVGPWLAVARTTTEIVFREDSVLRTAA